MCIVCTWGAIVGQVAREEDEHTLSQERAAESDPQQTLPALPKCWSHGIQCSP